MALRVLPAISRTPTHLDAFPEARCHAMPGSQGKPAWQVASGKLCWQDYLPVLETEPGLGIGQGLKATDWPGEGGPGGQGSPGYFLPSREATLPGQLGPSGPCGTPHANATGPFALTEPAVGREPKREFQKSHFN